MTLLLVGDGCWCGSACTGRLDVSFSLGEMASLRSIHSHLDMSACQQGQSCLTWFPSDTESLLDRADSQCRVACCHTVFGACLPGGTTAEALSLHDGSRSCSVPQCCKAVSQGRLTHPEDRQGPPLSQHAQACACGVMGYAVGSGFSLRFNDMMTGLETCLIWMGLQSSQVAQSSMAATSAMAAAATAVAKPVEAMVKPEPGWRATPPVPAPAPQVRWQSLMSCVGTW